MKIRMRAVPEDGKANAAVEKVLAKALGVARSSVRVERGAKDRIKLVRVWGDTLALARAKTLTGESI